jgi:hypothetical protein
LTTASEEFTQELNPLLEQCAQGQPADPARFLRCRLHQFSAGLRVLMMAARQAKAQMRHVSPWPRCTPLVQEVFTISRFNLIVPCYATVDAACEVLGT